MTSDNPRPPGPIFSFPCSTMQMTLQLGHQWQASRPGCQELHHDYSSFSADSFCFLKEMRDCWNSAKVRQPEAAADHRHTWVFCRAAGEKFLNDDLTAQTKGQILGGSPSAAWDTPSTRGDWAVSTFHSMAGKRRQRMGAGWLTASNPRPGAWGEADSHQGTDTEDCSCVFRACQRQGPAQAPTEAQSVVLATSRFSLRESRPTSERNPGN